MENETSTKYTVSFGLSLALSCMVNALLVVAKETSPAVQSGMKRMTGHHWVTHALVVLAVFLCCGCALARTNSDGGALLSMRRLIAVVVGGVAAGSLIIVGFYLTAG